MIKTILIFTFIVAGSALTPLAAQTNNLSSSLGTSWLKISPDTRNVGMGDSTVAVPDAFDEVDINPAGLGLFDGSNLSISQNFWAQGISAQHLVYSQGFSNGDGFSLGANYVIFGNVATYSVVGSTLTSTGGYSPIGQNLYAGYGLNWGGGLRAGLTAHFIYDDIQQNFPDQTWSLDTGLYYQLPGLPLSLSTVLSNLGFTIDGATLPLEVKAGAAYQLAWGGNFDSAPHLITLSGEADWYLNDANYDQVGVGAEYWYKNLIALRAGYQFSNIGNSTSLTGLSLGAAVKYLNWQLDYAMITLGDLGVANQISLSLKLGGNEKPTVSPSPTPTPMATARWTPTAVVIQTVIPLPTATPTLTDTFTMTVAVDIATDTPTVLVPVRRVKRVAKVLKAVLIPTPTAAFNSATVYQYVSQSGSFGVDNGQFLAPSAVAVDSAGNLYVTDTNNNRVQKFNSNGGYAAQWGSSGSSSGLFNYPLGVAIDSSGNLYVTDENNNRVEKFTSSGVYVTQWGSFGIGNGQFSNPTGVAVDPSGNVYVADTNNNRIQKFDSNGNYLAQWGSSGSGSGQFNFPFGLAVDSSDNVYVADTSNDRIQKFTYSGEYVTQWGSTGVGNGQFNAPHYLAVDSSGNVYVTDYNNNRVEKFDSGGDYLAQWGSYGIGNGQFSNLGGVAVDSSGNLYIVDRGNSRVQVFAPH